MKRVFLVLLVTGALGALAIFALKSAKPPIASVDSAAPSTPETHVDITTPTHPAISKPEISSPASTEKSVPLTANDATVQKNAAVLPASYTRWNPLIPATANMNVQSVVEATKSGKNPERLSAIFMPKPFDRQAFVADKALYCTVIEPGRVWQSSDKADAPPIKMVGATHRQVAPGGTVTLEAVGAPNSVISFNSFDLGAFENRLTSISVLTNEKGLAKATFRATPGTEGEVNVMAACPEAIGQLTYILFVGAN